MFDFTGLTINTVQILDPVSYPGAEYFNFFFTLVMIFGMMAFGFKLLIRIITRS
jgi:hypothetical protein